MTASSNKKLMYDCPVIAWMIKNITILPEAMKIPFCLMSKKDQDFRLLYILISNILQVFKII